MLPGKYLNPTVNSFKLGDNEKYLCYQYFLGYFNVIFFFKSKKLALKAGSILRIASPPAPGSDQDWTTLGLK